MKDDLELKKEKYVKRELEYRRIIEELQDEIRSKAVLGDYFKQWQRKAHRKRGPSREARANSLELWPFWSRISPLCVAPVSTPAGIPSQNNNRHR